MHGSDTGAHVFHAQLVRCLCADLAGNAIFQYFAFRLPTVYVSISASHVCIHIAESTGA